MMNKDRLEDIAYYMETAADMASGKTAAELEKLSGKLTSVCNRENVTDAEKEAILNTLAGLICKADKGKQYGVGDNIFSVIVTLRNEWGLNDD